MALSWNNKHNKTFPALQPADKKTMIMHDFEEYLTITWDIYDKNLSRNKE